MSNNTEHSQELCECQHKHDELTNRVLNRFWDHIAEPPELMELRGYDDVQFVNDIIALVRADERLRIREVLLSDEHEGPVHKAMSVWTSCEFLYRRNNEGGPTHEAAMGFAKAALEAAALAAIGLTEEGGAS